MKWFKHLSKSLNNSFISELIEKFGGDGYLVFFGTLELMSDEFDIFNPGVVKLRIKKLTQNLQLSRQKTVKILRFCDEKAKENPKKDVAFFVDFQKNHVTINCKKLAKLCDNHTQKLIKDAAKLVQSENEVTSSHRRRSKKKEEENTINKVFNLPSTEQINESSIPKIKADLDKICDELYEQKIFPDVHMFKNMMLKEGRNERAILHALARCYLKKTFDKPGGALAYCRKIIKIEDGNFNERDYLKTVPDNDRPF